MVGGPKTPQQIAAQKRLQQTQAQVDEVCINTKSARKKLLSLFKNLNISVCFFIGGGYYEDKRDESAGQGSKTV